MNHLKLAFKAGISLILFLFCYCTSIAQSGFEVNISLHAEKKALNFKSNLLEMVHGVEVERSPAQGASMMKAVPKIYDFHALGIFCKFDVELDAGSKIPLRFRLGTVAEVDALERKGPTRYNY